MIDNYPRLPPSLLIMLIDEFTFMAIVKVLATFRAKEAILRRRKCFYWQRFKKPENKNPERTIFSDASLYLPSRREWTRPTYKQRHKCRTPIIEVLRDSIYRKVQGVYFSGKLDEYEWGRRLQVFVSKIHNRVERNDFDFKKPRLWPKQKASSTGSKVKYRIISHYEDLSDRVILSLANKYLSKKLDHTLTNGCCAFRTSIKYTPSSIVRKIISLRKANKRNLYVAECDIVKFFDIVSHNLIRQILKKKLATVEGDESFLMLLEGYFRSYSLKNVSESNTIPKQVWQGESDLTGESYLKSLYNNSVDISQFGIPQGGALSGFLANLAMSSVDEAMKEVSGGDVFYARYCDDIILIAKTKKLCENAFHLCLAELSSLKIPFHPIIKDVQYGMSYYGMKSKGTFTWGASANAIPWISFLGYCVRFDGDVRIRKETIFAQALSIREECLKFLTENKRYGLRDTVKLTDVMADFLYRLISKGIGRINHNPLKGAGRCWVGAFRFVGESRYGIRQMRYLDKVRSAAIAFVEKKLNLKLRLSKGARTSLYLGKPFSYVGTAERLARASIACNRFFDVQEGGEKKMKPEDASDNTGDNLNLLDEINEVSGWERSSMGR